MLIIMSKINNTLVRDFTSLPNAIIQDDSISDRARFLFVYMATKPADWKFFQAPLCKGLGWSKDTLRKYMSELIEKGWVTCEGQKTESGKFLENEYTLHASPCRKFSDTVKNRNGKNPTLTKERLLQKKDYYNTHTKAKIQKTVSGIDTLDAGEKAAQHLTQFFEDNPGYLQEMENGDWKRAVKGHCNKLQREGQIYELTIPEDEGRHFQWLSKRIAGVKSWYQASADIDKKKSRKPQQQANSQPQTKYSPTGGAVESTKDHLRRKMQRAQQSYRLAVFAEKPQDQINELYHLWKDAEAAYQNHVE